MKPSLLIFPLFLLLAPYALAQHVLRLEARPLDRIPETEGSVWDLSDAARSETGHADYTVYGDTLFSETIDGVRRWYLMRADSVGFIREESMRHSFEPYGSVPTAATGMAGMESCIDTVRGEGFSYNTMRLLREGSYSSRGPVAGRLGTGARRTIGYDVHGWVRATGTSTRSGEFYEYIRYADDAAKPRYNGFISRRQWGKLNGFSHTYDYTYDGNGFLKQAQHADGMYTVGYAYDDRGNIVSMRRMGVTDMLRDGIPGGYGVLDDIAASYSGNQLTGLGVTSGAKTFSRRTGIGRTGGFTLAYDDAGRLSRDGSRDISSIRYDNGGHPSLVTFGNLSTVSYRRDGLGNLLETVYSERSGGTSSVPTFRLGERREYTSGGHVIVNGRLVMSRFGGGYFDASGKPHYYVTDWQGNNIGVVDRNGLLEQRTDYYPYGEPWLEPEATMSGQGSVVIRPGLPVSAEEGAQDIEATAASSSGSDTSVNVFLFGDKERTRSGGLNEYRFPARDYVPGFPRFTTVDPLAEKTPWLSPYAYCAANPVMLVDPTGGNPIYNSNGEFMGVDERGLQGLPVMMDVNDFKNGMSHDEAVVKFGKVRFSAETWNKVKEHHAQLPNRPDYDGFVTIEEGVRWAKDHPGAMDNPAPDNILYIDASQLDFGNLSADEFPSENVQRPVNLFNLGNTVKSAVNERLRATVYALGRCMMVLHDRNARTVSVVNDEATDYDWNRGDGAMRNIFLIVDNYINGLNPETHGFKTFYYGIGVLNQ